MVESLREKWDDSSESRREQFLYRIAHMLMEFGDIRNLVTLLRGSKRSERH